MVVALASPMSTRNRDAEPVTLKTVAFTHRCSNIDISCNRHGRRGGNRGKHNGNHDSIVVGFHDDVVVLAGLGSDMVATADFDSFAAGFGSTAKGFGAIVANSGSTTVAVAGRDRFRQRRGRTR